ncbi:hypothetical protein EGI97_21680, partial [Stutzerimonas xanthomarina]
SWRGLVEGAQCAKGGGGWLFMQCLLSCHAGLVPNYIDAIERTVRGDMDRMGEFPQHRYSAVRRAPLRLGR